MRDDFAVFILSHGRANNLITLNTLKECGYSGKWYIVIDDEDDQEQAYREKFGEKVLQFNKLEISKKFDTMDLQNERRTVVYARNACFELAEQIGVRYFVELDDDYKNFEMRYEESGKLKVKTIKNLDAVFEWFIDFLNESDCLTVAMAQGGDFIGGKDNGNIKKGLLRKAMNSFFCVTKKPFSFIGRINEDVNTYTTLGSIGKKIFTICDCSLTQVQTQKNKGGMSGVYLDSGTYLKSFYSVMAMPSAVSIKSMGDKNKRIHHSINWESCVPMIINQRYKK